MFKACCLLPAAPKCEPHTPCLAKCTQALKLLAGSGQRMHPCVCQSRELPLGIRRCFQLSASQVKDRSQAVQGCAQALAAWDMYLLTRLCRSIQLLPAVSVQKFAGFKAVHRHWETVLRQ